MGLAGASKSALSDEDELFILAEGDGDEEENEVAVEWWEGAGLAPM